MVSQVSKSAIPFCFPEGTPSTLSVSLSLVLLCLIVSLRFVAVGGMMLYVQAPAKVVEKVRADLKAQQEQVKTVQQCIADLDA